jgi:hypothetical protein
MPAATKTPSPELRESETDERSPDDWRRVRDQRRSWLRFLRHYLEMMAAMLVGMLLLGGAVRAILAVAAVDYSVDRHPEIVILEMAVSMSAGMVVWMRHRGHGWASTLEMAGATFAPAPVLYPLLWIGALGTGDLLEASHVLMLTLMLVVMLRRRHEHC